MDPQHFVAPGPPASTLAPRHGRVRRPFRRRSRWIRAFMFGVSVFGAAGAALPHAELRSSTPANGAVLTSPVREIVLAFTGAVHAPLSRIGLIGPGGAVVAVGPVEHPPEGTDHLRVRLDVPTPPGRYEVTWQAVGPDGHVVRGTFTFQVADSAEPPAQATPAAPPTGTPLPAAAQGEPPLTSVAAADAGDPGASVPLRTGTRWSQLLGAVLFLGIAGVRFGLLGTLGRRGALPEVRSRMRRGLRGYGWLAVLLLLVTLPLRLLIQIAELGGALDAGQMSHLLFQTAWGAGWWVHLAVVALGIIGLVLTAPRGLGDRGWTIFGGAAVLLPLVSVLQGHAWGQGGASGFGAAVMYFHVTGVGIWLGGLILLVAVALPAVQATPASPEEIGEEPEVLPTLARVVNAFSRIALLSATLVVVTGAVNGWLLVGGISNFVGTPYGRTLAVKLAVVAGAFALGFYNWRKVRPSLAERPDAGTLRIPATVEAGLGIVVLLVTSFLVATPTP